MRVQAHTLFFALALGQGSLAVLSWTFGGPPAGAPAAWHAHEMVFGYALGVIAGFLLTRTGPRPLLFLAGLWVAGRAGYAAAELLPALLRACASLAATTGIALSAAAGFLRGAKRGGNFVFPALTAAFPAADLLFQAGDLGLWRGGTAAGTWIGLGAVLMLIAAMGGRVVGAAASGALQRAGGPRLPPRLGLERTQLLALAAGTAAAATGASPPVAGCLLGLGGALVLARVVLWLPGLRRSSGDVLALAVGQAWLGVGLLAFGAASGLPPLAWTAVAVLHLAAIGGIGTTTLVMASRTTAQRDRRAMPAAAILLAAALMGGAALLRAFGSAAPGVAYPAAAVLWALASLAAAVRRSGARG